MTGKKRVALILWFLLMGVLVTAYPVISSYLNNKNQVKAVQGYSEEVEKENLQKIQQAKNEAIAYNTKLSAVASTSTMLKDKELLDLYPKMLNLSGTMGYITIPCIDLSLPIKHGVSEETLKSNVGHLEGTSLPVGGRGTHCVLSAHTGLPSAVLFTNISKMEKGDVFYIHTLDDTLKYRVDSIKSVLPEVTEDLKIEKDKDLATLITCTPYGINSHRLLVRGFRVPYHPPETEKIPDRTKQLSTIEVLTIGLYTLASMMVVTVLTLLVIKIRKRMI